MLLRLSGQHLDTVVDVKIKHKGIRVIRLVPQDPGHLMVCLHISTDAQPGTLVLQVSTPFLTTFANLPMFAESAAATSRDELTAAR